MAERDRDEGRRSTIASQGNRDDGKQPWPKRLLTNVDSFQQRHAWTALPFGVVKKFGEDRGGSLAALIAYYGFFSIFPLLLVLVTVLGIVLSGNPELQRQIVDSALAEFPVVGDELRQNSGRLNASGLGLLVGLATALWAGLGVMKVAQDAMNDVWDVRIRERPAFLKKILRAVAMLVVLGGGAVLTVVLTGAVSALGSGLPVRVLGFAAAAALNVGIFLLGFRVLTARDVGLKQLLPGAVLAGVAWMVLQALGSFLLTNQLQGASRTYGTFAVVIGLLWWLYLLAQVVLLSAELNVVRANRLWPRALVDDPKTEADHRALREHAQVEERRPPQDVRVHFDGEHHGSRR